MLNNFVVYLFNYINIRFKKTAYDDWTLFA